MAALEIIALDTATPQLRAPASGDTYAIPRSAAITGNLSFSANASSSAPSIDFGSTNGITYFSTGILLRAGGGLAAYVQSTGYKVASNGSFQFSTGSGDPTASADTALMRDASGRIASTSNVAGTYRDFIARQYYCDQTVTAGGTTGDRTINKGAGTVNFAAAAASLTVTNSLVTSNSEIYAVVRTNDTTAIIKNVVPTAGSFTITLNAAATAETSVGFIVIN